jgi:hypothetical protein
VFDNAGLFVAHDRIEAISQYTLSPFCKAVVVKMLSFPDCATLLFTLQVKIGLLPPFTGVALNVAVSPGHCGAIVVCIETSAGIKSLILIVSKLLNAVVLRMHSALENIVTCTTSPSLKLALVY